MKAITSGFETLGPLLLSGSLAWGLAACGGAPTTPSDDTLGEVHAAVSTSDAAPVQGDCTTVRTIDKVTLPSGDVVIRSTCSATCKKKAYTMGIYNHYIVLPGGDATPMVNNLGAGPTRSTQVETPYVPGLYQVSCLSEWKDKQDSTTYFGKNGPYTGGNF